MDQQFQEIPGSYGGVRLEEKIIQNIWDEGLFRKGRLFTECGKELVVLDSGFWNTCNEGPDFRNTSLLIAGKEKEGDVEVHFYSKDWESHGHHNDPNFDRVILHVSLFPDEFNQYKTISSRGDEIPKLVLLPYLHQGIEEYAEEFALRKLAGKSRPFQFVVKPKRLNPLLLHYAEKRWNEKISFANKRLSEKNWEEACHQWFMEILGYPRNRVLMNRLSINYPLDSWRRGVDSEKLFLSEKGWRLRGLRPASHPILRIKQYSELINKNPDWPSRLLEYSFVTECGGCKKDRKSLRVYEVRRFWIREILGYTWKGSRADTLLVDACLPLWSAQKKVNAFTLWYYWPAGDFPQKFRDLAKDWKLAKTGESLGNGVLQALLMHFLLDGINLGKQ